MLNNEARLFFSNWQGLGRHRGQRDTLNTVWQHPGQAPWSCWARVQRLHMAHNPPRDRPPLPSSLAPPPSPPAGESLSQRLPAFSSLNSHPSLSPSNPCSRSLDFLPAALSAPPSSFWS